MAKYKLQLEEEGWGNREPMKEWSSDSRKAQERFMGWERMRAHWATATLAEDASSSQPECLTPQLVASGDQTSTLLCAGYLTHSHLILSNSTRSVSSIPASPEGRELQRRYGTSNRDQRTGEEKVHFISIVNPSSDSPLSTQYGGWRPRAWEDTTQSSFSRSAVAVAW